MPIQVLFRAQAFILPTSDAIDHATMDMAWIGLFYLLRPGEHCKSHENTPIKLRDVTLLNGTRRLNPFTASAAEIAGATHSSITFDTQKNRERGETIGHSTSGHPIACPTKAIGRRILYLRSHHATPDTYLCAVRRTASWTHVTSALITASLRIATASLPHLNFAITDVSARSLRAGGAMALLCGKVDRDIIRLVGRWKSDAMFRYLHAQALPIIRNLASTILQHGAFTLLLGIDIPAEAATVIA